MSNAKQARSFEVGRPDLNLTRVTQADLAPPQPGEVLTDASPPAAAHVVELSLSRSA